MRTVIQGEAGFESARRLDGPAGVGWRGHGFTARVQAAPPAGWAAFRGAEVAQLRERLASCAATLHQRLLNDAIDRPDDEGLARWFAGRVDVPGLRRTELRRNARTGVVVDGDGAASAWRRFAFQSAHRLPHVPADHKCGRMHGHGFEAAVRVGAEGGQAQAALDAIEHGWAPLHAELDHACLNDLPGLANPTSELLASWLWQRLLPSLPSLAEVTVFETAGCGAAFDGDGHRIWKDFTLDSARVLRHAPDGHPQRRLHGHTYTLRLHLAAPLDTVLGWAVDFGDVKTLFTPIFLALDHRPLHEIVGLEDADTATLAHWILDHARRDLPQLDGVSLFETEGCGAIVSATDVR